MLFVTAFLASFLALGLFLAVRELCGFKPEPEWADVAKLREHLMSEIPPAPHHRCSSRMEIMRFCLSLRREFRSAWRLCRFLAPVALDPGYVWTLIVIKFRFNGMVAAALFCTAVGAGSLRDDLTEQLRGLGAAMRASALMILMDTDLEGGGATA
jgi:hypothetical protein